MRTVFVFPSSRGKTACILSCSCGWEQSTSRKIKEEVAAMHVRDKHPSDLNWGLREMRPQGNRR